MATTENPILDWMNGVDAGATTSTSTSSSFMDAITTAKPSDPETTERGRLTDLIGNGPIGGLVFPNDDPLLALQSVYLDGTPIQNSDGTYNWLGVYLAMVSGTNDQVYIPGFGGVETEILLSQEVKHSTPITQQISDVNAGSVRVKVSVPALYNADDAEEVDFTISIEDLGAPSPVWVDKITTEGYIRGKFTSKYVKGFLISLSGTTGPWNIRVTKNSDDVSSGSTTKCRTLTFESVTSIVPVKQRYPYSVIAELVVDSKKISRIPKRNYLIKGRILKVPANYDPIARTYATSGTGTTGGIWDGTFKDAWSDNPAWCWFDMVTNTLYGAGRRIDASLVDTGELYTIAQYCDELVSDGKGGTEPRFTCNCNISSAADAIKVLSYLASVFRGATYWAGGAVVPVQDRPRAASALYTSANVEGGKFSYSSTAKRARHTACIIWWCDPTNQYKKTAEYIEDSAGIARYGLNVLEITAYGCTSQGQAHRLGLWTLYSELARTETVSFGTGLEGSQNAPNDVIQVHDAPRFGTRHGGRVVSATTTAVTLDSPWTLESGHTYTLTCALPDGSIETRSVTNTVGATSTLTVDPAFSTAPQAQAEWILTDAGVHFPLSYSVISATEENGKHTLTGLIYDESIYAAVENNVAIHPTVYPATVYAAPVTDLVGGEILRLYGSSYGSQLLASWTPQPSATGYLAVAIVGGVKHEMTVSSASAVLNSAALGTYEIRVVALYPGGRCSTISSVTYTVTGSNGISAPATPENLAAFVQGDYLYLSWSPVSSAIFGSVAYEVRWGSTWDTAQVVGQTANTQMQLPAEGKYWVAAIQLKTYSTPASLDVASASFLRNVVQTWDEVSTSWPGTCSGAAVISGGLLTLDTSLGLTGTYEVPTAHVVDIATPQLCTVVARWNYYGSTGQAWDDVAVFDDWVSVDGVVSGYTTAQVQIALAQADGTFGVWQAYQPGSYTARKFKLRIVISTTDATVAPVVDTLSWTVDMPDRTEQSTNVTTSASGTAITYGTPFQVTPNTHVSITNQQSGDFYTITGASTTGFTVTCKNGTTGVSRVINWSSRGY